MNYQGYSCGDLRRELDNIRATIESRKAEQARHYAAKNYDKGDSYDRDIRSLRQQENEVERAMRNKNC